MSPEEKIRFPDISPIRILIFFWSESWYFCNPNTYLQKIQPRQIQLDPERDQTLFSQRYWHFCNNLNKIKMLPPLQCSKAKHFETRRFIIILSKRVLNNSVVSIHKDLRKVVVFYQSVSEVSKVCKRSESWRKMPHARECKYSHDMTYKYNLIENGNTVKWTENEKRCPSSRTCI